MTIVNQDARSSIRSSHELDEDTGEHLWWNNEYGWCGPELADSFSDDERKTFSLPDGGCWWPCPNDGGRWE